MEPKTLMQRKQRNKSTRVHAHNVHEINRVWYVLMYKTSNVICISMENI